MNTQQFKWPKNQCVRAAQALWLIALVATYPATATPEAQSPPTADASRDAEQVARDADQLKTRPPCTTIRFSGIAVGMSPSDLQLVNTSKETRRLLAINPLECSPSGMTQTYVCRGADFFNNHSGYIISWGKKWYRIVAPLDLVDTGTRATMLFINRSAARCADKKPPHILPSDNLEAFFKSPHGYR